MTHAHTIELTDETDARLREKAARAGLSVGQWLQRLAEKEAGIDPVDELVRAWKARTPEQIAAAREAVMKTVIPPRPLPPGKTLDDVVCGTWPGDETDEEIFAALERLS
jgi:hypothetical protein